MYKYVALLRGINVGGNKKVLMSDLKIALEKINLKNIKTILASGNIIFESENKNIDELQNDIAAAIEKAFGFPVPVLLRTFQDIDNIIEFDPFKGIKVTPQTRLYVTFLTEFPINKSAVKYISPDKSFKIISTYDKTIFSVLDLSVSNTPEAMDTIEKKYSKNVTTRNWNTITKIAESK